MEKTVKNRLIEARKRKEYSQEYVSSVLGMNTSCYSRRENGQIRISNKEWQKLSEILETPLDDIYESDESMTFFFNDNSSGNGNIVSNYSIPQSLWDVQKKYMEKLEEEIRHLKEENEFLRSIKPDNPLS